LAEIFDLKVQANDKMFRRKNLMTFLNSKVLINLWHKTSGVDVTITIFFEKLAFFSTSKCLHNLALF
jgi:hypothetical protein